MVYFEFYPLYFFDNYGTLITLIELIFTDLLISENQQNQRYQRSIISETFIIAKRVYKKLFS